MTYNLTGIVSNSTSFLEFTRGVNDVLMFGWLGTVMLIGVCIVIFIATIYVSNDVKKALITSSFIGFTMSLTLRALELAPRITVFVTLIILALVLAVSFKDN